MLRIHGRADRQRHTAQQLAGLCQVGVLEAQQSGNSAAAQGGFFEHRVGAVIQARELGLIWVVEGVSAQAELPHGAAHQQGPTARYKNTHHTVFVLEHAGLHIGAQFFEQLIALVQQVIGLLARAAGVGYFPVHLRDALGQAVDRRHRRPQLCADAPLQVVDLARH